MADGESKHEKALKRIQLWVAVLAGIVTFAIGAYNAKNLYFSKKGPGTIAIVAQMDNGSPIAQASIEILKVQGGVVITSSTTQDGKYETKLEPANYNLKISKVNFQPESVFFTIEPAVKTDLNLRMKPVASTIRSTVEEVGSSWLKNFSSRKLNPQSQTQTNTTQ